MPFVHATTVPSPENIYYIILYIYYYMYIYIYIMCVYIYIYVRMRAALRKPLWRGSLEGPKLLGPSLSVLQTPVPESRIECLRFVQDLYKNLPTLENLHVHTITLALVSI